MAQVTFGYVDQGYSPYEVDHYIDMLQQEYRNAVEWSEDVEKQLNDAKAEAERNQLLIAELRAKNEQLLKDCRGLAVKLNDFSTGRVRIEDLYIDRDRLKTENEYLKGQLNIGVSDSGDVVTRLFNDMMDSVEQTKRDSQLKSTEAIAKANERASAIIKNATQKSIEINAKNDLIVRNLENIYDMLGEVLEDLEKQNNA